MKKAIITFILIWLYVLAFSQMTITEHVQADFFGGKLDYKVYKSKTPSTKWLVFLPGTTELGANDGTQLWELDKFGYMKAAKNGHEFPFNILAIQPASSFSSVSKALLPWVEMEFKPSAIILIGISLGAIASNDLLTKDKYNLIKAVVPLSGKASNISNVPNMVSVQGYAWHGMLDTKVSYKSAIQFYETYNEYQKANNKPGRFIIESVPGVAHSGWDQAMSITPGKDQILQFIIKQFGPEPVEKPPHSFDTIRIKIITDRPYIIEP